MGTVFEFKKRYALLILLIFLIWAFFPLIFKIVMSWMVLTDTDLASFGSYGPIGDIYGSLNTLISSIALCAVAISTLLQVKSLKENRISITRQLNLAKEAHDEQIKESRHAVFASQFYSLLNFKKDKLNSIVLSKIHYDDNGKFHHSEVKGLNAIDDIAFEFLEKIKNDSNFYQKLNHKELLQKFYNLTQGLDYESVSTLISYFHIYSNFCNLIRKSKLDKEDTDFYKSVLSNSMTQHEQIILFFISPMFRSLDLENCEIFSLFGYLDFLEPYAKDYHNASHFKHDEWKNVF